MRHIASLFAGMIIAPIAWLLIGAAQIGLNPMAYELDGGSPGRFIAIAMFVVAGALLGLIAVTRLSPAGPILAGLAFIGGFFVFRGGIAAVHLPDAMTNDLLPRESAIIAGETGMVLVIGALLLMSALIPSRWRGKQSEEEPERADLDTASLAGTTLTPQDTTDAAGDPYAGTSRPSDTPTDGYAERPVNPFDTTQPAPQQPVTAQQRSPYADDAYGADGYDYESDHAASGQQRYSEQRYGGHR